MFSICKAVQALRVTSVCCRICKNNQQPSLLNQFEKVYLVRLVIHIKIKSFENHEKYC